MPCLRSGFVSAIIWKISGSYDLEEIESLWEWAMYRPEHYINDSSKKRAILSDELLIEKINELLNFIFSCDGVNVDLENNSFSLSGVTSCELQSFNELISKNNEKYNFELKSIRSLIEAGLTKVDIKMEKDLKTYEENFTILKS